MMEPFHDGRVHLHAGDCRDVLAALPAESAHACVTDPPYELGFMSRAWDRSGVTFDAALWSAVKRVLKPGAHLVAFGGTRTYHRMACAIEDAGFEVRDQIGFCYGSGFPKSHNINQAAAESICGCGTASIRERHLRSVRNGGLQAPVPVSSKHREVLFDRLPEQGAPAEEPSPATAARCRESGMEGRSDLSQAPRKLCDRQVCPVPDGVSDDGASGRLRDGTPAGDGASDRASVDANRVRASHRPPTTEQLCEQPGTVALQSEPQERGAWPYCERCGKPILPAGLGSALKPAWEPIVLARKPLSEKTIAANVLKHGTGALNIDACRVETDDNLNGGAYSGDQRARETGGDFLGQLDRGIGEYRQPLGRWPANIIHDDSDEVVGAFPESGPAKAGMRGEQHSGRHGGLADLGSNIKSGTNTIRGIDDCGGSAARFWYSAKADANDRLGSKHPTVKPVDLMQWLCRLVTPPGGIVLDPFAGTGTTGEAALREGFRAALIEREAEYQADIRRRMSLVFAGPDERSRATVKASGKVEAAGPLFGEMERGGAATDSSTGNSHGTNNRAGRIEEIAP